MFHYRLFPIKFRPKITSKKIILDQTNDETLLAHEPYYVWDHGWSHVFYFNIKMICQV